MAFTTHCKYIFNQTSVSIQFTAKWATLCYKLNFSNVFVQTINHQQLILQLHVKKIHKYKLIVKLQTLEN